MYIAFGQNVRRKGDIYCARLHISEDDMSTDLTQPNPAIEFLRRDKTELSPAQYLKRLKQLELEFADLLTLLCNRNPPKEEIHFALAVGRALIKSV